MEELYNKLKGLDKNTLQVLILLLMEERIIEYSDITEVYVQHLQSLYKGCSDAYDRLQAKVVEMFCDHKKTAPMTSRTSCACLWKRGELI